MTVVTVIIGNSDDKLGQRRWSTFCGEVAEVLGGRAQSVHFCGFSAPDARWQNACWVVDINPSSAAVARADLGKLAEKYGQDAVAWLEATGVEFLHAG